MSRRSGSHHLRESEKSYQTIQGILNHHRQFIKKQRKRLHENDQLLKDTRTCKSFTSDDVLVSTDGALGSKNSNSPPVDSLWKIERFMRDHENTSTRSRNTKYANYRDPNTHDKRITRNDDGRKIQVEKKVQLIRQYNQRSNEYTTENITKTYHGYPPIIPSNNRIQKQDGSYKHITTEEYSKEQDENCNYGCCPSQISYNVHNLGDNRRVYHQSKFADKTHHKNVKRRTSRFREIDFGDEMPEESKKQNTYAIYHVKTNKKNMNEKRSDPAYTKEDNIIDLNKKVYNTCQKHTRYGRISDDDGVEVGTKMQKMSINYTKAIANDVQNKNEIDDPRVLEIAKIIVDFFQKDSENELNKKSVNKYETGNKLSSKSNDEEYPEISFVPRHSRMTEEELIEKRDAYEEEISSQRTESNFTIQNSRGSFKKYPQVQMASKKSSTHRERVSRTRTTVSPTFIKSRNFNEQACNFNYCKQNRNKSLADRRKSSRLREVSVRLENQLPLYDENAHLLGFLKEGGLLGILLL